jgi:hypothetical protein
LRTWCVAVVAHMVAVMVVVVAVVAHMVAVVHIK